MATYGATSDSTDATMDGNVAVDRVVNVRAEKRRILKNIILISIAFLMTFNAFQGLSRLQSSLHKVDGMGVINSSVLYVSLVLSCLFLPKLITNAIGHKWTIPISFVGYITWMAANGYAVWATMVPASIIVGLTAAPLWTAQCSYFTKIARRYSQLADVAEDVVLSRFFGIFFFTFQLSGITGSIISATVLKTGTSKTNLPDDFILENCGAHDCPCDNCSNVNLEKPPVSTVWTMVGVYMVIAVLAVVLVCVFVDNLPADLTEKRGKVGKEIRQLVSATAFHLRHKNQLILIPLTMYSGFEQASFNAEFSKSFVACSAGIWKVGLVTLPFGVVDALVSFASGHVVGYTGRLPVFIAGMLVDLAIQIVLMTWVPTSTSQYALFIIAGMWGFTDAIWQTQINALYGTIFSDESEAAFSNYRMWESLGFIIAFAYSNYLCTSVKLYILTSMLLVGMAGYVYVEVTMKHKSRSRDITTDVTRQVAPQSDADTQHPVVMKMTTNSDKASKNKPVDGYDNKAAEADIDGVDEL